MTTPRTKALLEIVSQAGGELAIAGTLQEIAALAGDQGLAEIQPLPHGRVLVRITKAGYRIAPPGKRLTCEVIPGKRGPQRIAR